MGDEVLKQFETLQIGSHQELSGGVYLPNEVSKSPDAKKIGHSIILPPEVINEPDAPNHVDSHQQPRLGSSRRRRKTRKQKEADVAQDVASNTPPSQFGEIPASTKQELHPPHYLFSQHPASPVATRSQSRRESQKASRFLPQNPRTKAQKADTTLLPHGQKFFSSTSAAGTKLALPFRSKQFAETSGQADQSPSSPDINSEDHGGGKSRGSEEPEVIHKFKNSQKLIHLPAPEPTKSYLANAKTPLDRRPMPQRLLLVLDLNGTLLFRTSKTTSYVPRSGLEAFLDYCFANHSVLIWSSATPRNVGGVCKKIFNPAQRNLLLGEWGRDTFRLTPQQYQQRVQVYKHLDIVWSNPQIQSQHPDFGAGGRWGQENTVLIDDSVLKAAAQPFNLLRVPEFAQSDDPLAVTQGVLEQVRLKLEELRTWSNVSALMMVQQAGDEIKVV